jgi:hypothetical protein
MKQKVKKQKALKKSSQKGTWTSTAFCAGPLAPKKKPGLRRQKLFVLGGKMPSSPPFGTIWQRNEALQTAV